MVCTDASRGAGNWVRSRRKGWGMANSISAERAGDRARKGFPATTVARRAAFEVEFWAVRLSEESAGVLRGNTPVRSSMSANSIGAPNLPVAKVDQLRPESFVPHPDYPAVMLRRLGTSREFCPDSISARVLKANPEMSWPQPAWWRRSKGTLISLLVSGTAWFDIAGVGEVSVSSKDSWSLAKGVDYALLEASSDFHMLEIELGDIGEQQRWPLDGLSTFQGKYSYRPVTHFVGRTRQGTNGPARTNFGDPPFVSLPDNLHRVWDGCPWRITDHTIQFGYITAGAATIELEGIGVVDADLGTFWIQDKSGNEFHQR